MKEVNDYILHELQHGGGSEPVVTVFADLNYDYIYESPPLEPGREVIIDEFGRHLAGAGGYVSCGLARLGAVVYLLTDLGDDEDGRLLYREIERFGVRSEGIRLVDGKRSPFTLIFTGAGEETPRQVATFPGTSLHLSIDSVDYKSYLACSDLVYSCNYFILKRLREEIRFVFRDARKANVLTAYDANAGDDWDREGALETLLKRIYPLTDIVFLNEQEAGYLTGSGEPLHHIDKLSPESTTVVIKMGERGVVLRHRGYMYRCSAFPVGGKVRDTVGAGDSFQAAFLYFYLRRFPIELCMVLGAANAASTVQYAGGTEGQRGPEELEKLIGEYRILDHGNRTISIESR
jgi:sugar/nucleoside kinase (ribokinase family)